MFFGKMAHLEMIYHEETAVFRRYVKFPLGNTIPLNVYDTNYAYIYMII